jgi:4-amino-4-deoxy-L-arabinose transferase-like glycosyltransferase
LLVRGHVPYRDFVFVHPPGITYLLSPVAWLRPERGFEVARLAMTLVGAFSIFLVGRLALRNMGAAPAIVAALVYATYPEAVALEHGVFLEPLMNVFLLCAMTLWLKEGEGETEQRDSARWWALGAGLLCGVALAVKLTAAVAVLAFLACPPARKRVGDAYSNTSAASL